MEDNYEKILANLVHRFITETGIGVDPAIYEFLKKTAKVISDLERS